MSLAHEHHGDIPPSTLALRLRESREWRKLDQNFLAEELDVSRGTISNFERGVTKPSKLQINHWAVVCRVNVEWLKTGNTTPEDNGPSGGGMDNLHLPYSQAGGGQDNLHLRYSQDGAPVIPLRRAA